VRFAGTLDALRSLYSSDTQFSQVSFVSIGVAPHSLTSRGSVAVPSGRFLLVKQVAMRVRRATAATTPGRVRALLSVDGTPVLMADFLGNTVDLSDSVTLGECPIAIGPATVSLQTEDTSTGGTCDYSLLLSYVMPRI
jgi:hypothetical protein